jgi:hypothetical protein
MAPSNMNDKTGWAALLAEPGGRYKSVLAVIRRLTSTPPAGGAEMLLAGADQAVAAIAALRGPAECREFFAAIEPFVAHIGRRLAMFPESVNNHSTLTLLSLTAISETVGMPLVLPSFDLDAKLTDIMVDREASLRDKATAALVSLGLGRVDHVRRLFGKGAPPKPAASADPVALARVLAAATKSPSGSKDVEPAWEAFVRGFPAALQGEKVEWRHLLLAARIVLGKLGGTSMGEVAEALHRRIVALAAEESP